MAPGNLKWWGFFAKWLKVSGMMRAVGLFSDTIFSAPFPQCVLAQCLCWCRAAASPSQLLKSIMGWPPTSIRGVGTRWSLMSLPTQAVLWFYDMLSNNILYYFHLPFQAFIGFFKLLFQKRTPEYIRNLSYSRSSGSIKSYVIFLGSCLKVSGSGTAPVNPRFVVELSALWRCQHCARRPAAMAQQICISKCVWGRP